MSHSAFPSITNYHTASSTNLDIPDVTILVFRDKPPHFALAQRGQATCPRSHSKAGAQLGPLTPSPVLSWGLLEIANSISGWSITAPQAPGCPVHPALLDGQKRVPAPQPGAPGCLQCVGGLWDQRSGMGRLGFRALTLMGAPVWETPWGMGRGPRPAWVPGLLLPLLLWPSMSAALGSPGSLRLWLQLLRSWGPVMSSAVSTC